jgi:hypothetical protein
MGFSLIWQIWWLAILGFLAAATRCGDEEVSVCCPDSRLEHRA